MDCVQSKLVLFSINYLLNMNIEIVENSFLYVDSTIYSF